MFKPGFSKIQDKQNLQENSAQDNAWQRDWALQDPNKKTQVNIYLAKPLEFEKGQSYTLTSQVRNAPDHSDVAQLNIKVEDKNNQSPIFTDSDSGLVGEHKPAGKPFIRDGPRNADGTYSNNRVIYWSDNKDTEMPDPQQVPHCEQGQEQ